MSGKSDIREWRYVNVIISEADLVFVDSCGEVSEANISFTHLLV